MEPQTTAPSAPRYGAATLANTTTTTTTTTSGIKWGGVIKGVAVVGAVVLAGVGVYLGVSWLFSGVPASTALSQMMATGKEILTGPGGITDFITKTIPDWFFNTVIPFVNNEVWPTIGKWGSQLIAWGGDLLAYVGIISKDVAANAGALAGVTEQAYVFGPGAASAAHSVALTAGMGAVALAAPGAIHSLANTQIIEHAVAEHVTHHAAEHAERTTEKKWADTRITPRAAAAPVAPRESSFAAQVDKDTAALNAALKTPAV